MPTQASPSSPGGKLVCAAGAVLWRPGQRESGVEIAVIHRPRYDDWSLPKGKVDPGETEPVTAVREVFEETGHRVHLGRRIATVCYQIEKGTKKVHYWSASNVGGSFAPGAEVDDLLWLPTSTALKKLSYLQDRKVLRWFAKHPADTQTLLVVRHGVAGRKSRFKGDDTKRPLDKTGRAQAEALVGQLLAFGASDVYAAERVRCHQTVQPLAEELGVAVCNEPVLTEEAYAENPKRGRRRLEQIAGLRDEPTKRKGTQSKSALVRTPVICTQGKVIPDLIGWWCDRDGVRPDRARNRKGSTWVLSLSAGRLVAADHIGSALPTNVAT